MSSEALSPKLAMYSQMQDNKSKVNISTRLKDSLNTLDGKSFKPNKHFRAKSQNRKDFLHSELSKIFIFE